MLILQHKVNTMHISAWMQQKDPKQNLFLHYFFVLFYFFLSTYQLYQSRSEQSLISPYHLQEHCVPYKKHVQDLRTRAVPVPVSSCNLAQRAGLGGFSAWGGLSSVKLIHVGLSVLTSTCKSAKEANAHVFSKENQIKNDFIQNKISWRKYTGNWPFSAQKKINYKNKSLLLHTRTRQIYSHCFREK